VRDRRFCHQIRQSFPDPRYESAAEQNPLNTAISATVSSKDRPMTRLDGSRCNFLIRNSQTALAISGKALYLSPSSVRQPRPLQGTLAVHTPSQTQKFFNFPCFDRLTKNTLSRILRDQPRVTRLPLFFGRLGGTIGPRGLPIFDNLVMKLLLSSAVRGCCLVVL